MRVALVHDWLTGMRGGERVLLEFLELYPAADIFTLLHIPEATDRKIDERVRQSSWLGKIPGAGRWYRHLLPFYPFAVRSLHIDGYDLVISLSHAAAKNVTVGGTAKHLCYCFTPMRYIWDQAEHYFGWKRHLFMPILCALRRWDVASSGSVDGFACISNFIRARIRCFYKRESTVIYPPVRTGWIEPVKEGVRGEAYLYAGALVPYKRPDAVIDAFNRNGKRLWVAGDGPLSGTLRERAGPNIEFLGPVSDASLSDLYARCRALIFPGVEDFGIIPVECLAAGRPVIAFARGGGKETVTGLKYWKKEKFNRSFHTGVFIKPNGINLLDSLLSSIDYFETIESEFDPVVCSARAREFSPTVFQARWREFERKELSE